jgi:hypothetical protein
MHEGHLAHAVGDVEEAVHQHRSYPNERFTPRGLGNGAVSSAKDLWTPVLVDQDRSHHSSALSLGAWIGL